jgi:stress response protein YsnF
MKGETNMDLELISQVIERLGLPVALVIAMGGFIFLLWKQSAKRETKLYEELAACREVNKQAIETLTLYAERLSVIESDVKDIKDSVTGSTCNN